MTEPQWKTEDVGHRHGERVVLSADGWLWATTGMRCIDQAQEIKPLAVIDPESDDDMDRLMKCFATLPSGVQGRDRVQAALREYASPKQPKPDQPTGLGAVVEDDKGKLWVYVPAGQDDLFPWLSAGPNGDGEWQTWSNVDAVRVLDHGLSR